VASNFFYKVPIKPKMSLGAIKQAASDFSQAAKDLVSTGQLSVTSLATSGPSQAASVASLTAAPPPQRVLWLMLVSVTPAICWNHQLSGRRWTGRKTTRRPSSTLRRGPR
jgi:hypothetical protein